MEYRKGRFRVISPLNKVKGIQATDWRRGAIIPAEFVPPLLFKSDLSV
jgi:hypothetical protein